MRYAISVGVSVVALLSLCVPISAAEEANPAAAAPEKPPELTQEEKAEKEARMACKAKICDIIPTRDPVGEDVSCDIVKTWRGRTSPTSGLSQGSESSFMVGAYGFVGARGMKKGDGRHTARSIAQPRSGIWQPAHVPVAPPFRGKPHRAAH